MLVWTQHRTTNNGIKTNYFDKIKGMKRGPLALDKTWIKYAIDQESLIITAYSKVFDVSTYLDQVEKPQFLGKNIENIIKAFGKNGQDGCTM